MNEQEIIDIANSDNSECLERSDLASKFMETKLYLDIFTSVFERKGAGKAGTVGCKLLDIITLLSKKGDKKCK